FAETLEDPDEKTGAKILARALEEPIRKIAENAGYEGSVVVNKVREASGAFGFDAEREIYCDLMDAGVIDPTKVTRIALENAVSIAGLLITTEALVSEIPEKEKKSGLPSPGMSDMY
ncbi:MAG: TCP-1/cpn60 chaperonin family protein, partial [bacterium]